MGITSSVISVTEQTYALYEWHHEDTGKAYVGIYKYTPERDYIASTKVEEFWEAHAAGKLTRKITWIADEATIRCMENDILATVNDYGDTDAFYNLCFSGGPIGIFLTDEIREKLSAKTKQQWEDPEFKEKMSGENHPMKRPEVRVKFTGENNPMCI